VQWSLPPQVWFVLFGQVDPAQQGWPLPPQIWQREPIVSQANGALQ
jgi:hypothetical protein